MAIVFIELLLPGIHIADKQVCILADVERSDDAVIRTWLSIGRLALTDQKNLFREVLDIVAVFHHRYISDVTQQGRL